MNENNSSPMAPGMLSRHYAPKTKTIVSENIKEELKKHKNLKIGLLLFKDDIDSCENIVKEILTNKKDLKEAATNLYAAMHRLDRKNLDLIIAEKFPNNSLGKSINDRLNRATK